MSITKQTSRATTKTIISTIGTIAATAMVARSIVRDYVPSEIQDYFHLGLRHFFSHFSNELTMVINEYEEIERNEIYDAAVVYVGSKVSPNTRRLRVTKLKQENNVSLTMERDEEVIDTFNGVEFKWTWVCQQLQQSNTYYNDDQNQKRSFRSEVRFFELSFHRKHKEQAVNSYLPFILKEAKDRKQEFRTLKIFTLLSRYDFSSSLDKWKSVSLDHPATFETLAMDAQLKETVIKDLERFVARKDKYKKVGKAWKRGYLLYGPPSSLIAAMANYLKLDIYDLELTDIKRNSDLRKLLIATANRSILVVEDIDCNIELHERVSAESKDRKQENRVTLSGFLNFIDGLWSSCGDERIIIFTTNHKEKLDPALLRPGRMDMHIRMSYCTPCGFRLLAGNYLGVEDHKLFPEIEELILTTKVTPAEVAEQLLKSDEPDVSLDSLISFVRTKNKKYEEAKAKKATAEVAASVTEAAKNCEKGDQSQESDKIQKPEV
ncbi:hypothetical protein ACET3Z_027152 [Daucus carota]